MRWSLGMVGLLAAACAAPGESEAPLVGRVMTQEEQQALQPDEVVRQLKEGNQHFVSGTVTRRDLSAQVRAASGGQFPRAIILSCVDSRIPVENVFDLGIGDIFVARVAGNFENTDILGSMEFATKVAGAKLVVVMGHEDCGAVKSAIDRVELGNITAMLENIHPALDAHADYDGEQTSKNAEFLELVTEENVRLTVDRIRERSPIMREMEEQGEIQVIGALYDMDTGVVEFLE